DKACQGDEDSCRPDLFLDSNQRRGIHDGQSLRPKGLPFFAIQYRNMGNARDPVRNMAPGEVPMLIWSGRYLKPCRPIGRMGEESRPFRPYCKKVGMSGVK